MNERTDWHGQLKGSGSQAKILLNERLRVKALCEGVKGPFLGVKRWDDIFGWREKQEDQSLQQHAQDPAGLAKPDRFRMIQNNSNSISIIQYDIFLFTRNANFHAQSVTTPL